MLFIVTIGDLDGPGVFILVVIVTMDAETCRIGVQEMGPELEFFHNFHDDPVEQIGGTVVVNAVKGTKNDIIVQMFWGDAGTKQLFRR